MTQHTPDQYMSALVGMRDTALASLPDDIRDGPMPDAWYNAMILAEAAPSLLAALEELQEAIDAIDETNDGAAWHRVAVAQGKARAAIAQAKGE